MASRKECVERHYKSQLLIRKRSFENVIEQIIRSTRKRLPYNLKSTLMTRI